MKEGEGQGAIACLKHGEERRARFSHATRGPRRIGSVQTESTWDRAEPGSLVSASQRRVQALRHQRIPTLEIRVVAEKSQQDRVHPH